MRVLRDLVERSVERCVAIDIDRAPDLAAYVALGLALRDESVNPVPALDRRMAEPQRRHRSGQDGLRRGHAGRAGRSRPALAARDRSRRTSPRGGHRHDCLAMSLFDRIKALLKPQSVQLCLLPLATVVVTLSRSDLGEAITGATVTVTGPTPGGGSTDASAR